jgi:phenylpyruvate tautomerase PptA (4-oxalocrotonate tautomerase family)
MPMLDVHIPEDALDSAAEKALLGNLTDILLRWEGADPSNERVRSIAWAFLHRPADVFVGGQAPEHPHYRIVASVPEGQLNAERRSGLVKEMTDAVLDAEPADRPRDASRVWVFTHDVPEGTWGAGGRVFGLADIAGFAIGDAEAGAAHAKKRLAAAKAEREAILS